MCVFHSSEGKEENIFICATASPDVVVQAFPRLTGLGLCDPDSTVSCNNEWVDPAKSFPILNGSESFSTSSGKCGFNSAVRCLEFFGKSWSLSVLLVQRPLRVRLSATFQPRVCPGWRRALTQIGTEVSRSCFGMWRDFALPALLLFSALLGLLVSLWSVEKWF